MAANQDNNNINDGMIDAAFAKEMLAYARNSDHAPPAFNLKVRRCQSSQALEFVGSALRDNTCIEWLEIIFDDRAFTADSMKDVFYFVTNNPALKVLILKGCGGRANESVLQLGRLLLEAAAQNKNIEKICFNSDISEGICHSLNSWTFLKELELGFISESLVEAWPESHAIERLRFDSRVVSTRAAEQKRNLNLLFRKLANSSSNSIKSIDCNCWFSYLPDFISSHKSSVESLNFWRIDFSLSEGTECSMDRLLRALMGSRTTEKLHFRYCGFDESALRNFLIALQANELPIKDLTFAESQFYFSNEFLHRLFNCDCLEALGLDYSLDDDQQIELVEKRIESSRLSTLRLECESKPPGPTLKPALASSSLTTLELSGMDMSEEDVQSIVGLLEDKSGPLRNLQLSFFYAVVDVGVPESRILKALENNVNLQSLSIGFGSSLLLIVNALTDSLENIKNLRCLEVMCEPESSFAPEMEVGLAQALPNNWSLEHFCIISKHYKPDKYRKPIMPPALCSKVKPFTERNKFRNAVAAASFADHLSTWEGIAQLEKFWSLPDGLSLAFWMFQKVPHLFFRTSPPTMGARSKKRKIA